MQQEYFYFLDSVKKQQRYYWRTPYARVT